MSGATATGKERRKEGYRGRKGGRKGERKEGRGGGREGGREGPPTWCSIILEFGRAIRMPGAPAVKSNDPIDAAYKEEGSQTCANENVSSLPSSLPPFPPPSLPGPCRWWPREDVYTASCHRSLSPPLRSHRAS